MHRVLVTTRWLRDVMTTSNHRVLDASWHLPNTGRNAAHEYEKKHIPGALFFDIDECANKATDLPHMIPSIAAFEDYVGALGISNNTHVIVYDNHPQFPIFSAQRVWWTFRLFGHEKISILEGGLPKWLSEGGAVTNEISNVSKEKFKASFNSQLVKSFEDIEKNIKFHRFMLIDARPEWRFQGTAPEPRADIKPGCIPHSVNIPFMNVFNLEERTVKSAAELRELFENSGVDLTKEIVATCGSGISACILALAAQLCQKDDVAVYDGSWTEWFLRAPVQFKCNVPD